MTKTFTCSMQKKKESFAKKSEAAEIKDKQYYLDMFDKAYKECVQLDIDNGGNGEGWADYFTDTKNYGDFTQKEADEIVGYYMEFHPEADEEPDRPYRDWLDNTRGLELTPLDKEITRILKALYAPNESTKSEGVEALKDKVVSDGTLKPEDLIPKFLNALKHDETAHSKFLKDYPEILEIQSWDDVDDETKSMLVDELTDALNGIAPDGYFFGASDGDGACFGFWKVDPDESKKSEGANALPTKEEMKRVVDGLKKDKAFSRRYSVDDSVLYGAIDSEWSPVMSIKDKKTGKTYATILFDGDGKIRINGFPSSPIEGDSSDIDWILEVLRNKKPSESKKSEGVGGKIKMGIDYNMFMRMCASAAYLDENEDYWDALWEYYSEMGEIEDACEFFDNLFQYTSWCDEDEVYDEYLDDSYKDGTKSKAECIESAVDAGDLDVFKTDKGYLVIQ